MSQFTFPITSYRGKRPNTLAPAPTSGPTNVYATAVCQGPGGESLELIYLRPDTSQWLDFLGRLNQTAANSYDPVSKRGVAYFNACDFAWHYALLACGRNVQAQVDDAYPGGNRIFSELTMPVPSATPVPDVVDWLNHHTNVYEALQWNEPTSGGLRYASWPAAKQLEFRQAFAAAWNHQPMILDDPPPNLVSYDNGTVFDASHAWLLFCAHAAYSLATEIGSRVPWSITGYSSADLELLLHGGNMFRYSPAQNGYRLQLTAVPAAPAVTWAFLTSNRLLGNDRLATIARVLDWCRNHLSHFSGAPTAANMTAHWGYAGVPPVLRIIQGTICTAAPEWGVRHYTAGCWGTTGFLQALLRIVNIPVEPTFVGGHTLPHFTTDDRYLSHGDDPYSFFSKCSPPYDAGLLLIDGATFNRWFGPGVPSATATDNVGRRSTELAVRHLPDGLLHLRYRERAAGLSPADGYVYPELRLIYPNLSDLSDLWPRMDAKLAAFGYADRVFPGAEIVVPPAPFPSFGQVQRGFRMVRSITIENTGDTVLTFTARITGADAALYGLVQDPPADSIVNVVNTRPYAVGAVSPCGSAPVEGGRTTVAVVFYANDAPRLTQAELVIEGHNATNGVPAAFSYPLAAQIVAPIAVDAGLVLDRSGSMAQLIGARRKTDAVVAGGRLFAELIRPDRDDRLAIVKYCEVIEVLQPVGYVTSANQPGIVAHINTTDLAPRGTTCVAGGVAVALDQLAVPRATAPSALNKAMVVLTDGMDNTAYHNPTDGRWYSILGGNSWNPAGGMVPTQPLSTPSDVRIYGIGLGRAEDIDTAALNRLSTVTGAYFGVVGDLIGPSYFALEKYFTQVYMDVVGTSAVSDPVYRIGPGQQQKIEFDVLQGDLRVLVVVFDYESTRLPFSIVTPKGEVIDTLVVPPGYDVRVGSATTARFVELLLPPGQPQRYAGRWTILVEHRGEVYSGEVGSKKDMRRGFLPFKSRKYKQPVDYGIAIGVGSNFRMQPDVTAAPVRVGDPILLTAALSEAGLPVAQCNVTVKIVAPSGATWNVKLLNDGAREGSDGAEGEYARRFTHTSEAGTYEFTFHAVGVSRDGERVSREAVRAKYVEGRIVVDPKGGRPGEPDWCCERLVKLMEKALGGKEAMEASPRDDRTPLPQTAAKPSKTKKTR